MTKLTKQNVGGVDYSTAGCALTGVCTSAASDYVKTATLSDGDVLNDGMMLVVTFTNGNTAGNAPGTQTIYSSDQVNYFSDSGLTTPFTLAAAGCYTIEYTGAGNAYTYQSYPKLSVGGVTAPLATAEGKLSGGALWQAGSTVQLLYTGGKFCVLPSNNGSAFTTASSATVIGAPLVAGGTVRIMFTSAVTGADTTTPLTLNYNGASIPVKVGKNGALSNFVASQVSGSYIYVQAYTTLELAFDGSQFIIVGNPVVVSSADYTIYADGYKDVTTYDEDQSLSIGSKTFYFRRSGIVVSMNSPGDIDTSLLTLGSFTTIGRLPEMFRPITQINCCVENGFNETNNVVFLRISTDGYVSLYSNSSAGIINCSMNTSYIVMK